MRVRVMLLVGLSVLLCSGALAQDSVKESTLSESELEPLFRDAQVIDLRTSKVSSVVTLRDVIKIPPPTTPVLVKTFKRGRLPDALKPAFPNPGVMGVTIFGRFVAILDTPFENERQDVLRHELVHAYITMASPKTLPFWFQEGSAVHFSTDTGQKYYGKPSNDQIGVLEGHTVDLTDTYKQKLRSFDYLIDKAGTKKFYEWYRKTVESGDVDPRPLVGLAADDAETAAPTRSFSVWFGLVIGVVVVAVLVIGFYAARKDHEFV